jgi:putative ABC transport system permease protein
MISALALRVALWLIRTVALVVPRARRLAWRNEWEAELQHHATYLRCRRRRSWSTDVDLISRALGCLPDAAWIRRQFTLDAEVVHDLIYGTRALAKSPASAAITLLVFGTGIGAAIAIVSVADTLFMRPLPVTYPERVMTIWQQNRVSGAERLDVAPANALDWLARATSFQTLAIADPFTFNLNSAGREPDYLTAARVSEHFFTVLGTFAHHGRLFLPEEYRRGAPRVVILSHPLWTSRFAADPSIVGTALRLDAGAPYTVVGVMPRNLELRLFEDRARRAEVQVWMPKTGFDDAESRLRVYGAWNVLGRLRPGVSVSEARRELDLISAQLAREYAETNSTVSAQVIPLRTHLAGGLRDLLPFLLGAAAILLMVSCANVASLLLARGTAREREFAVRQALGASRPRLVRQMLVESLALAVAAGIVGLVGARWMLDVVGRLRPADVALVDRMPMDLRSAVLACGVTAVAALLAGLMPALQLSRPAAVTALREGRTGSRRSVGAILVVLEMAAALVLVVGAGLLVRSFVLLDRVDPGFSRDHVSVLQVFASNRLATPEKRVVFFDEVLSRLRALPGVIAAGAVTAMPFGDARVMARGRLEVPSYPLPPGDDGFVYTTAVSGDFFKAMKVPLLAGRLFEATDTSSSRQVVVVSQRAGRHFWKGADPLGSRVRFQFSGKAFDAEVVGMVGDLRHEALDAPAPAELFLPYSQSGFRALTFVVRTAPDSPIDLRTLKEQIWALDPRQTIFSAANLDQLVSKTLSQRRFDLVVLGGFALVALLLAAGGVYGLISFATSQRIREFGIRAALGATDGDIIRLVLADGVKLALVGIIAGISVALPAVHLLKTLLFGVTATDPITFVSVSVMLLFVSVAACYVPARRALKIGPAEALR